MFGKKPMFGKNPWAISCSKKTADQIEATRNSKRSKMKTKMKIFSKMKTKMKIFWATDPEAKAKSAEKQKLTIPAKLANLANLGRPKEVLPHES